MQSYTQKELISANKDQLSSESAIPSAFQADLPSKQEVLWQKRLMPWMITVPTILIISFIAFASMRMSKMESFIYQKDAVPINNILISPERLDSNESTNEKLQYMRLYVLTRMEQYSINKRYNQAATISMSTIYTKYLGFFTGMILAIVGAVFIISKLKESSTNLEGSYNEHIRFKLLSSSPGIIFALLGTILMTITIMHKGEVKVNDSPLYLNHYNLFYSSEAVVPNTIDKTNINKLTDTNITTKGISPEQAAKVNLSK